jgi:hypothetical protein
MTTPTTEGEFEVLFVQQYQELLHSQAQFKMFTNTLRAARMFQGIASKRASAASASSTPRKSNELEQNANNGRNSSSNNRQSSRENNLTVPSTPAA